MSEEQTERLNGESNFQTQVLAGLAAINGRLTSIEDRLTSVENRMTSLEGRMTSLEGRVSSLEDRVSTMDGRLTTLDGRMTALEEKVDSRLCETRPIWEAVLSQLKLIEAKLEVIWKDMLTTRGEIDLLKQRVPPAA